MDSDNLSTYSNNPPVAVLRPVEFFSLWLRQRLGADGRVIYATGSVEASQKYKSKPVGYQPDIAAYLRGQVGHVYGSWLYRGDGTTFVLAFDLDRPEHHRSYRRYQERLAQDGVPSIYWQRGMDGRERGHLELYFDRPVDPERARAWIIWKCPDLEQVTECFPTGQRKASALSWPLYQQIGDKVSPCVPVVQTHTGAILGDVRDTRKLAILIQQTIISASQVEMFEPLPNWDPVDQPIAQDGVDVVKLVIAEFNETHSWEEVTILWGGIHRRRFRNGERGERTASVVIDRDGQYACDFGDLQEGRYPRKLDKYEVWVRANRIDKRRDLEQRCREYRQRMALS